MDPITIAILVASGVLAAGGIGTNIWNTLGSGRKGPSISKQELVDTLRAQGMDEYADLISQQTEASIQAALDSHWKEDNSWANAGGLWGGDRYTFDREGALRDLFTSLQNIENDPMPEAPRASDYFSDEYLDSIIGDRMAELESLRSEYQTQYDDTIRGIDEDYGAMRQNLLATQSRQNAELMDTMRSEMSRSRRNALEAGASAGIRLADNINIMLSNQNKQAQTSLETSNQLAQMAINQRAAKSQAQGQYNQYMQQNFDSRSNLRQQGLSEANSRYNAAMGDYDVQHSAWNDRHAADIGTSAFASNLYKKGKQSGAYGGSN